MGDRSVYRYYLAALGKNLSPCSCYSVSVGGLFSTGNRLAEVLVRGRCFQPSSRSKLLLHSLYRFPNVVPWILVRLCFVCYRTMIQISGSKLIRRLSTLFITLSFFTIPHRAHHNLFSTDVALVDTELPVALTNLALDVCNASGWPGYIQRLPLPHHHLPFIFVILTDSENLPPNSRQLDFWTSNSRVRSSSRSCHPVSD